MLLANVAWILAAAGRRVLVVDWDLEAPGLHHYYAPFLLDARLTDSEGLIDLIVDYASEAVSTSAAESDLDAWLAQVADPTSYTVALDWRFPGKGALHLLPAGRQNASYSTRVNSFDWRHFYEQLNGAAFFDHLRTRVGATYDYILIDSRTGVSDTAGICSVQMPDTVVACFTANEQSTIGASGICESIKAQWRQMRVSDDRRIFPIMCRVEQAEKEKLEKAREQARRSFTRVLRPLTELEQDAYWSTAQVLYWPWYAYEEVLAVFGDRRSYEGSVLASSEMVAANVSDGDVRRLEHFPSPPDRERVLARYERKGQEQSFDAVAVLASGTWAEAEFALEYLQSVARLKVATSAFADLFAIMERRPSAPVLVFLGDGVGSGPDDTLSRLGAERQRRVIVVRLSPAQTVPPGLAACPTIDLSSTSGRDDALLSLQHLIVSNEVLALDDARFADLRMLRRVTTQSGEWIRSGMQSDYLLAGSVLADTEEWLARTRAVLGQQEGDFLAASRRAQEGRNLAQQFAVVQRAEAEAIGRLGEANKQRRLAWGIAAGLAIGLAMLAVFAIRESARVASAFADSAAARANTDREVAQLVRSARDNAERRPVFSLLLLAEAVRRSALQSSLGIPTADAAEALRSQLAVVGGRSLTLQSVAPVVALAIAPDSSFIAAAQQRFTRIWNARSGALIKTLPPMAGAVTALRVSGGGTRLAIGDDAGAVRIADAKTFGTILDFPGDGIGAVQRIDFDSNETMVLVTASAGVRIYSTETTGGLSLPREISQIDPSIALARPLKGEAFFGNNRGDIFIAMLERRGTDLLVAKVLDGHLFGSRVTAVESNRDVLAAGSAEGAIAAFRWEGGQRIDGPVALGAGVKSLDLSDVLRDGSVLSGLSTSGVLKLTDLGRAELVGGISYLDGGKFSLAALAPTGDAILSVSSDNVAHLTCVGGSKTTVSLLGHDAEISVARFDPESRFVVTAARDGGIRIWYLKHSGGPEGPGCQELDTPPDAKPTQQQATVTAIDLLAQARLAVGRNFTEQEWREAFPNPNEQRAATFSDLPLDFPDK
jgi:WD40 repeat protein/MinD-like ATPase involved in chromosome partitioning or flagellar assembly